MRPLELLLYLGAHGVFHRPAGSIFLGNRSSVFQDEEQDRSSGRKNGPKNLCFSGHASPFPDACRRGTAFPSRRAQLQIPLLHMSLFS